MTYALIDNSTLTAVQRLLGVIPVRSTDIVDGDIVALENLLQAILFYDEIIAIDDYKTQFREARMRDFPYIKFIPPASLGLEKVQAVAHNEARSLHPRIVGGEFADQDIKAFLAELKTHMFVTWDVTSSIYYLNLKLLGLADSDEFEKYRRLSSSIFSELGDRSESEDKIQTPGVTLIDRFGKEIDKDYVVRGKDGNCQNTGGMSSGLEYFIASIAWLSYRTIYYSLASQYLHADLFLYPVRQAYHRHYMGKKQVYDRNFLGEIHGLLSGRTKLELTTTLNANRTGIVAFNLPIFAAWIISQTHDIAGAIPTAFELRNHSSIFSARAVLKEIRVSLEQAGEAAATRAVQKHIGDLERIVGAIRRDFGLQTNQGIKTSTLIKVFNPVLSVLGIPPVPVIGENPILPGLMERIMRPSALACLYRDVGRDLTNVAQLGQIRTLLADKVVIDMDKPSFTPKAENPKFRNAFSSWKSPM